MKVNRLKQLWKENKTALNAWITSDSSWTAELMANTGLDAMTIDAQHGLATDYPTILPILQAISTTETTPLVRIPSNDSGFIMRMLDGGAYGIICPMVDNRKEAESFVGACRYVPDGYRSFGPNRALLQFGEDYFKIANEEIITMAMIETLDGLKNVDDIAKTPTLTGFYIGPWDLSICMQRPQMANFKDPELLRAFDKVLNVAAKNNQIAGIQCPSPEVAQDMSEMGFRLVTAMNDSTLMKQGAIEAVNKFRNFQSENTSKGNSPYA